MEIDSFIDAFSVWGDLSRCRRAASVSLPPPSSRPPESERASCGLGLELRLESPAVSLCCCSSSSTEASEALKAFGGSVRVSTCENVLGSTGEGERAGDGVSYSTRGSLFSTPTPTPIDEVVQWGAANGDEDQQQQQQQQPCRVSPMIDALFRTPSGQHHDHVDPSPNPPISMHMTTTATTTTTASTPLTMNNNNNQLNNNNNNSTPPHHPYLVPFHSANTSPGSLILSRSAAALKRSSDLIDELAPSLTMGGMPSRSASGTTTPSMHHVPAYCAGLEDRSGSGLAMMDSSAAALEEKAKATNEKSNNNKKKMDREKKLKDDVEEEEEEEEEEEDFGLFQSSDRDSGTFIYEKDDDIQWSQGDPSSSLLEEAAAPTQKKSTKEKEEEEEKAGEEEMEEEDDWVAMDPRGSQVEDSIGVSVAAPPCEAATQRLNRYKAILSLPALLQYLNPKQPQAGISEKKGMENSCFTSTRLKHASASRLSADNRSRCSSSHSSRSSDVVQGDGDETERKEKVAPPPQQKDTEGTLATKCSRNRFSVPSTRTFSSLVSFASTHHRHRHHHSRDNCHSRSCSGSSRSGSSQSDESADDVSRKRKREEGKGLARRMASLRSSPSLQAETCEEVFRYLTANFEELDEGVHFSSALALLGLAHTLPVDWDPSNLARDTPAFISANEGGEAPSPLSSLSSTLPSLFYRCCATTPTVPLCYFMAGVFLPVLSFGVDVEHVVDAVPWDVKYLTQGTPNRDSAGTGADAGAGAGPDGAPPPLLSAGSVRNHRDNVKAFYPSLLRRRGRVLVRDAFRHSAPIGFTHDHCPQDEALEALEPAQDANGVALFIRDYENVVQRFYHRFPSVVLFPLRLTAWWGGRGEDHETENLSAGWWEAMAAAAAAADSSSSSDGDDDDHDDDEEDNKDEHRRVDPMAALTPSSSPQAVEAARRWKRGVVPPPSSSPSFSSPPPPLPHRGFGDTAALPSSCPSTVPPLCTPALTPTRALQPRSRRRGSSCTRSSTSRRAPLISLGLAFALDYNAKSWRKSSSISFTSAVPGVGGLHHRQGSGLSTPTSAGEPSFSESGVRSPVWFSTATPGGNDGKAMTTSQSSTSFPVFSPTAALPSSSHHHQNRGSGERGFSWSPAALAALHRQRLFSSLSAWFQSPAYQRSSSPSHSPPPSACSSYAMKVSVDVLLPLLQSSPMLFYTLELMQRQVEQAGQPGPPSMAAAAAMKTNASECGWGFIRDYLLPELLHIGSGSFPLPVDDDGITPRPSQATAAPVVWASSPNTVAIAVEFIANIMEATAWFRRHTSCFAPPTHPPPPQQQWRQWQWLTGDSAYHECLEEDASAWRQCDAEAAAGKADGGSAFTGPRGPCGVGFYPSTGMSTLMAKRGSQRLESVHRLWSRVQVAFVVAATAETEQTPPSWQTRQNASFPLSSAHVSAILRAAEHAGLLAPHSGGKGMARPSPPSMPPPNSSSRAEKLERFLCQPLLVPVTAETGGEMRGPGGASQSVGEALSVVVCWWRERLLEVQAGLRQRMVQADLVRWRQPQPQPQPPTRVSRPSVSPCVDGVNPLPLSVSQGSASSVASSRRTSSLQTSFTWTSLWGGITAAHDTAVSHHKSTLPPRDTPLSHPAACRALPDDPVLETATAAAAEAEDDDTITSGGGPVLEWGPGPSRRIMRRPCRPGMAPRPLPSFFPPLQRGKERRPRTHSCTGSEGGRGGGVPRPASSAQDLTGGSGSSDDEDDEDDDEDDEDERAHGEPQRHSGGAVMGSMASRPAASNVAAARAARSLLRSAAIHPMVSISSSSSPYSIPLPSEYPYGVSGPPSLSATPPTSSLGTTPVTLRGAAPGLLGLSTSLQDHPPRCVFPNTFIRQALIRTLPHWIVGGWMGEPSTAVPSLACDVAPPVNGRAIPIPIPIQRGAPQTVPSQRRTPTATPPPSSSFLAWIRLARCRVRLASHLYSEVFVSSSEKVSQPGQDVAAMETALCSYRRCIGELAYELVQQARLSALWLQPPPPPQTRTRKEAGYLTGGNEALTNNKNNNKKEEEEEEEEVLKDHQGQEVEVEGEEREGGGEAWIKEKELDAARGLLVLMIESTAVFVRSAALPTVSAQLPPSTHTGKDFLASAASSNTFGLAPLHNVSTSAFSIASPSRVRSPYQPFFRVRWLLSEYTASYWHCLLWALLELYKSIVKVQKRRDNGNDDGDDLRMWEKKLVWLVPSTVVHLCQAFQPFWDTRRAANSATEKQLFNLSLTRGNSFSSNALGDTSVQGIYTPCPIHHTTTTHNNNRSFTFCSSQAPGADNPFNPTSPTHAVDPFRRGREGEHGVKPGGTEILFSSSTAMRGGGSILPPLFAEWAARNRQEGCRELQQSRALIAAAAPSHVLLAYATEITNLSTAIATAVAVAGGGGDGAYSHRYGYSQPPSLSVSSLPYESPSAVLACSTPPPPPPTAAAAAAVAPWSEETGSAMHVMWMAVAQFQESVVWVFADRVALSSSSSAAAANGTAAAAKAMTAVAMGRPLWANVVAEAEEEGEGEGEGGGGGGGMELGRAAAAVTQAGAGFTLQEDLEEAEMGEVEDGERDIVAQQLLLLMSSLGAVHHHLQKVFLSLTARASNGVESARRRSVRPPSTSSGTVSGGALRQSSHTWGAVCDTVQPLYATCHTLWGHLLEAAVESFTRPEAPLHTFPLSLRALSAGDGDTGGIAVGARSPETNEEAARHWRHHIDHVLSQPIPIRAAAAVAVAVPQTRKMNQPLEERLGTAAAASSSSGSCCCCCPPPPPATKTTTVEGIPSPLCREEICKGMLRMIQPNAVRLAELWCGAERRHYRMRMEGARLVCILLSHAIYALGPEELLKCWLASKYPPPQQQEEEEEEEEAHGGDGKPQRKTALQLFLLLKETLLPLLIHALVQDRTKPVRDAACDAVTGLLLHRLAPIAAVPVYITTTSTASTRTTTTTTPTTTTPSMRMADDVASLDIIQSATTLPPLDVKEGDEAGDRNSGTTTTTNNNNNNNNNSSSSSRNHKNNSTPESESQNTRGEEERKMVRSLYDILVNAMLWPLILQSLANENSTGVKPQDAPEKETDEKKNSSCLAGSEKKPHPLSLAPSTRYTQRIAQLELAIRLGVDRRRVLFPLLRVLAVDPVLNVRLKVARVLEDALCRSHQQEDMLLQQQQQQQQQQQHRYQRQQQSQSYSDAPRTSAERDEGDGDVVVMGESEEESAACSPLLSNLLQRIQRKEQENHQSPHLTAAAPTIKSEVQQLDEDADGCTEHAVSVANVDEKRATFPNKEMATDNAEARDPLPTFSLSPTAPKNKRKNNPSGAALSRERERGEQQHINGNSSQAVFSSAASSCTEVPRRELPPLFFPVPTPVSAHLTFNSHERQHKVTPILRHLLKDSVEDVRLHAAAALVLCY